MSGSSRYPKTAWGSSSTALLKATFSVLGSFLPSIIHRVPFHSEWCALVHEAWGRSLLSECFEQSYEKLYPLLIAQRVAMAIDLAEDRQLWPDESDNPKHATLTLLKDTAGEI